MNVRMFSGLLLIIPSVLLSFAAAREWTDATGKYKVEAELDSVSEDGKTVTLRKADGKTVDIPREKLEKSDQRYIQETLRARDKALAEAQAAEQKAKDRDLAAEASKVADLPRKWVNQKGTRTLDARFALLSEDRKTAIFLRGNGEIARLSMNDLSAPDIEYIWSILRERELEAGKMRQMAENERLNAERERQERLDEEKLSGKETAPLYGGKFLEIPFNPDVDSLPPDFRGHDVKRLWEVFSGITGKGEFESTSDYRDRLNSTFAKPVYGSVLPSSTLAVCLDRTSSMLDLKYDADTEKYRVKVSVNSSSFDYFIQMYGFPSSTLSSLKYDIRYIDVDRELDSIGKYVGSNAFGAESLVTERQTTQYSLVYPRRKRHDAMRFEPDVTVPDVVVPVPKKDAWQIRSAIGILAVFRLDPFCVENLRTCAPYTCQNYSWLRPTRDHPVDSTIHYRCFYVRRLRFLIFNSETGEVYAKIPVPNMGTINTWGIE